MLKWFLSVCLVLAFPIGGLAAEMPVTESYRLMVENDRVSLHARESSLRAVVTDLAGRLALDVRNLKVPDQETVSVEIDALPVDQALADLGRRTGYAFFVVPGNETTRRGELVMVVTSRMKTVSSPIDDDATAPKARETSFRFRLEPAKVRREKGDQP